MKTHPTMPETGQQTSVRDQMAVPDPDMTAFELDVLRVMNGEEMPDMVGGAAMWSACAWLKGRGYAEGHYSISQKGREYLEALSPRKGGSDE